MDYPSPSLYKLQTIHTSQNYHKQTYSFCYQISFLFSSALATMASNHHISTLVLLLITFFLLLQPHPSNSNPLKICHFDQIYQLGDSISDTGNLIRETPIGALTPFAKLPYGETFFNNATGRCSNGLLMIDYFGM